MESARDEFIELKMVENNDSFRTEHLTEENHWSVVTSASKRIAFGNVSPAVSYPGNKFLFIEWRWPIEF
jgi:hypothetical protein